MAEHVKDEKIMEPYLYLGQILGKNVRGILIDCFQEWISIPEEKMEIIKVSFIAILMLPAVRLRLFRSI